MELCAASIDELQELIRTGEVTRRHIVEAHLSRIAAVNPQTNTFAELRPEAALAEADAADAARGHTIEGALDGVPMSIKDSYSIVGLNRTDGLLAYANRRSTQDDSVVTRLRDAGAIILGHGNIPDLCVRWNTISSVYGTSRNPRDLSLTVGGSSGGEGGNVAAGMATVALGQDLGGSVRVPASFCGVYGIRVSPGVVPNVTATPAFPSTPTNQMMGTVGPLARSVADLEAVYGVIAGVDPLDPISIPLAEAAESAALPRVAVLRNETGAVITPEIERRLQQTIGFLRDEGYEVVEGVFPDLHRAPEVWGEINGTDLMRSVIPRIGDQMIESGRQHIEQMFGSVELGDDITAYNNAWIERSTLLDTWVRFAEDFPLTVAPVAGMPTPPLEFDHMLSLDDTKALFDLMRCVPWVNLLGLPGLALPNGIQLIGRRFHEYEVFAAARAVERSLPRVEIAPAI
jgi:amidase